MENKLATKLFAFSIFDAILLHPDGARPRCGPAHSIQLDELQLLVQNMILNFCARASRGGGVCLAPGRGSKVPTQMR